MKPKLTILFILILLFLPYSYGSADIGAGIVAKYDVPSGAFHTGVSGLVTTFGGRILAVGQGTWAEEVKSADKQVSAALDIMWLSAPKDKWSLYIALGPDVDWLKTEYAATTYLKAAMGFGGRLQAGKLSIFGGVRSKTIGGGEDMNEVRGIATYTF